MKILKISLVTILLGTVAATIASPGLPTLLIRQAAAIPAKTIIFKNMAAEDTDKFFSDNTVFSFEIYQPGSKAETDALIAALKKDPAVESMNAGTVTGDYHAFTLVLKKAKSKQWFSSTFKKAGVGHIRINRRDITEIEKL